MWVYVWLGITVFSLVIEFMTSDLISIWFAGGGIIAIILAACGLEWYVQSPAFFVVSLILLFCFRRLALKVFNKEESKTNADSAIGKEYQLLDAIGFNQPGSIKINDVVWSAVCEEQNKEIPKGAIVKVISIKGNKYIVEEVK